MESLLDKFTLKLKLSAFPTMGKYTGTIFTTLRQAILTLYCSVVIMLFCGPVDMIA